jgi:hypothetical protein
MPITHLFRPEDDLLHDEHSAASPSARESLLITAPLPDEQLLLFVYLWREGGTNWGRFLFIAGPDVSKAEYLNVASDGVYTGNDLLDFEVSGLRWRQPEPLQVAEIAYADGECELSLRFEGLHAPFSWHDTPTGCPTWVAADRYEQSGRTSGRLRLRGRELSFAGVGHRDHSWGNRDWSYFQHWKWINAASQDGTRSIHCMVMIVQGETTVLGYTNRDGVLSPIVSGSVKADLDAAMFQRGLTGVVVDETGAEMRIEAQFTAGYTMPIHHLVLNEVGMSAVLDGRPATAHVEFGWPADYVRGLTETT